MITKIEFQFTDDDTEQHLRVKRIVRGEEAFSALHKILQGVRGIRKHGSPVTLSREQQDAIDAILNDATADLADLL